MRGMREFRAAVSTLLAIELETLEHMCDGLTSQAIARAGGVTESAVWKRIGRVSMKLRQVPGMNSADGVKVEAICYRLGYEQALTDIEQRLKRKAA